MPKAHDARRSRTRGGARVSNVRVDVRYAESRLQLLARSGPQLTARPRRSALSDKEIS